MRPFEMETSFRERAESRRNMAAFWLLGLFNNSAYVIMIAGAVTISGSAVGLVYLCAVFPGIFLKATAPYWIHKISYSVRTVIAAALMAGSYTTVAWSTSRTPQLLGVVLASLQGALGEASCLALTSHYNSQAAITMWSSGTGFAGVFGYSWVMILHVMFEWSFEDTLMAAQTTVIAFLATYFMLLESPDGRTKQVRQLMVEDEQLVGAAMAAMDGNGGTSGSGSLPRAHSKNGITDEYTEAIEDSEDTASLLSSSNGARQREPPRHVLGKASKAARMSPRERLTQTLALWPYTIPLFTVYAAEYAMQAGVWVSIGLPNVGDPAARQRFYSAANWCYQAGVFVSRSSGMLWQAHRRALWFMPIAQVCLLGMFLTVAVTHFWYNWSLLLPCFGAGLLGGAVYVNSFTLIAREVEPQYREFSLGAASVADSAGIAVADVASIFIQGCLFKANAIKGADYSC